jgi:hypothetical protein
MTSGLYMIVVEKRASWKWFLVFVVQLDMLCIHMIAQFYSPEVEEHSTDDDEVFAHSSIRRGRGTISTMFCWINPCHRSVQQFGYNL